MLELLLSKQFAEIALLLLSAMGIVGILRTSSATSKMVGLVREFSRWQTSAADENSFLQYKASVQSFCLRSGSRLCSMWLAFLDEVNLQAQGNSLVATCSGESLEKLRENLLFAYGTSCRVARHTGTILAGMGLSSGLGILCAAALKAAPYFASTSTSPRSNLSDQGLSVLIAGGGLGLLTASVSLLASVAATAFDRSQLARAEAAVDRLIAILRMQFVIRIGDSRANHLQPTVALSEESTGFVARAVAAGFEKLVSSEAEWRELGKEDSANLKAIKASLEEYISSSMRSVDALKASHNESSALRDTVTAALGQIVDLGSAQAKFWESLLLELRSNRESTLSLEKALNETSRTPQTQASGKTITEKFSEPALAENLLSEIKQGFVSVSRKLDKIDRGIAQDVDDLLAQARKSQSILVQTLSERQEHSLPMAVATEATRKALEPEKNPSAKPEEKPKLHLKAQKISLRRSTRPASRKKVTAEEVINLKSLMAETRKSLLRALERAQDSTATEREVTRFCDDAGVAINKLIELIIEQTDARMNRYGNAYEPLAESNTFVCEILSKALLDLGDFRRQGAPEATGASRDSIQDLANRILNLEEFLPLSHQTNRLRRTHVNKLEIAWNRAQKAAARHKSWIAPPKSTLNQKSRVNKMEHFRTLAKDLQGKIVQLQEIVETTVLDQVAQWPSVLDQARQVRESTRHIATTGARWARTAASNKPNTHGGLGQIIQAVEGTEEILLSAEMNKEPVQGSTSAPR